MRRMICRGSTGTLPGFSPVMAGLLLSRGISTPEEARDFLHPRESLLSDPLLMENMAEARDLILACVRERRKTVIYGDYDCDGVCASLILKEAFAALGHHADIYIPDRREEGYGLNETAVRRLSREYSLLITVDCGITSLQEVAAAKAAGMTVIVTDHHNIPEERPAADLILHPQCGSHPCRNLCGAGVAYKLACALLQQNRLPSLELCALATIADMVPLLGENRTIAALGLAAMADTRRPGLRALMESAGLSRGQRVTGTQAAFQLAPRINACGRMDTAQTALDLLSAEEPDRARTLAQRTEELNSRRRTLEQQVITEAEQQVQQMDLTKRRAIVIAGDQWESGVVGLAAGRLAEHYGYPAVVLSRDGDTCKGSGRSACGVDLYRALSECADLFTRFGGHRQAAGMTLPADRTEELARRLSEAVEKQLQGRPLMPETAYDCTLKLNDITLDLIEETALLEPFGTDNPAPVFLIQDADVLSARAIGRDGLHLKMLLSQEGKVMDAVAFRMGHRASSLQGPCALAVSPQSNTFNGHTEAECRVEAIGRAAVKFAGTLQEETLDILQELKRFCRINDNSVPTALSGLPAPDDAQGILYLCRTAETARAILAAYPDLDIPEGPGPDPRAYSAVWLCSALDRKGPYSRVILCDGLLCPGEAAAAAQAYPSAQIFALPRTPALSDRLNTLRFSVEELRETYKKLRTGEKPDLSQPRAAAMAAVLQSMELADDRMRLLPVKKADPLQDPLYQIIEGGGR